MRHLVLDESAQGLVEYALVIAFIALVCIVSLSALGSKLPNEYSKATVELS